MLNEHSILQDRMSNIKKKTTIAELLGISNRFKHLNDDKDEKSKYISKMLFEFNINEKNEFLAIMISDLADYRMYVQKSKINNQSDFNVPSTTECLFYYLEKNLIEISYIKNKERRHQKIKELYHWFQNKKKCDEDLRTITMKTYKEKGVVDKQEELYLMLKDDKEKIIEDDSSHRNLDLINKKMLNDYERKRLLGSSLGNSMLPSSVSFETLSILGKDPMNQTLSKFSNDIQSGDITTIYSSINGTNSYTKKKLDNEIKSFIDKPEGGLLEKDYDSQIFWDNNDFLPSINKETKYSYSYFRPPYMFNEVYLENKIIESKQKSLAIKRAQEEIKEKIKEFGIYRAKYKEIINNKYELKNMIKMYVNRNKLSSPLLRKYKLNLKDDIKNENDNTNKKLNMNFSLSNINTPGSINITQKNTNSIVTEKKEENKINFPSNKGIIKIGSDISNNSNIRPPMKKISFSFSQKIITLDMKEEDKESNDSYKSNRLTPKRSLSFKKKTKFLKKKSSNQNSIPTLKLYSGINNKIKIDKIQNLDIKSKRLIDIENMKTKNYKISLPEEQIKSQIIENNKKNIKKAPDALTHIISNLPVIKEKFVFNNICQVKLKSKNQKDNIESKSLEESFSPNQNICFSSINKENTNSLHKTSNKSNLINIKKNYFGDLNQRYNLYKHNFLNMRKSMSNDKKREYEYLFNKLVKKRHNNYSCDNCDYEFIETENTRNNSNLVNNGVGKSIRLKKNNSLFEAMVNPNENPVYSRYFLPRNESMLLSRDEQIKKNIIE